MYSKWVNPRRLIAAYGARHPELATNLAALRRQPLDAWVIAEKIGADLKLRSVASTICLTAYIACFAAVFLTNSIHLPRFIYLWVVLPLGAPASLRFVRRPVSISIIFCAGVAYLLLIGAGSIADPGVSLHMEKSYISMSVQVLGFLLVTCMLVWDSPTRFLNTFFLVMSPIVALSAFVNMIEFTHATPLSSLADYRLFALFGMQGWRNATQIAPTYAIFLIGALGTFAAWR